MLAQSPGFRKDDDGRESGSTLARTTHKVSPDFEPDRGG